MNASVNSDLRAALVERVKQQPPLWSPQALRSVPKPKFLRLKDFVATRYRTQEGVVALHDLDRFISRDGDVCLTWSALMRLCALRVKGDPRLWDAEYWLDPAPKQTPAFTAIDRWVVVTRGLYLTALARHALHYRQTDSLCGVRVERWSVDWDFFHDVLLLERLGKRRFPHYVLTPEQERVSEQVQGRWTVDEHRLTLRRTDSRYGRVERLDREAVQGWLAQLGQQGGLPATRLEAFKRDALAA